MNTKVNRTRLQWALAFSLAMIAGYLDGYGLCFLGTYVSFMSGNTTSTGLKSGQGDFHAALPSALAILFFVTGSFLGNLLSQSRLRYVHRVTFGLIASGLAIIVAVECWGVRDIFFEIGLLCLAMGMMNPVLTKIGSESISLTFVTGTLNRIGGHLASAARRRPLEGSEDHRDSHLMRAGIEASMWCGFLGGAVLSGIAGADLRTWTLLPPSAAMFAISLFGEYSAAPSRDQAVYPASTAGDRMLAVSRTDLPSSSRN
jgi:uncharacterized membrane protein YoaK (UPF0700 family)